MLQSPASVGELPPQLTHTDSHSQLLHERVLQPLDSTAGHYDDLGVEFMPQPMMTSDPHLVDSEMVLASNDFGLSDFVFPSLDVNMTDDGATMPDLLSTLSTDIAQLLY